VSEADSGKVQDLSPKGVFLRSFTPGKCLVFGFRALFNGGGTINNSQAETITQFAHAHEDELWCQGDNIEVSDRDESAARASGGKAVKRPREETCGRGGSEEVSKPPRKDSPRKEPVGSRNLGEVSTPGVAPV
jgi:hypothetical protein